MNTQDKTIKIGFDSKTEIYVIDPSAITSVPSTIEVNGESIQDPIRKRVIGGLVTFKQKPETITYRSKNRVLTHFENISGDIHTVAEYEAEKSRLLANAEYNEDLDENVFPSIEEEVAYQVFSRSFKPVYEYQETLHNVDFEIIEYPVSEYSEIVPIYSLDAKHIFDTKCKVTIDERTLFNQVLREVDPLGNYQVTYPNHSGIRYAKLNGEFVGGTEEYQKRFSQTRILLYAECVSYLESATRELRNLITMHINKKSKLNTKQVLSGELLTELINLKSRFEGINPRAAEANTYHSLTTRLGKLINNVNSNITLQS